jgi:hypothetical protein
MTNLLVTTPQALLRHEVESGKTFIVENSRPAYYGISWFSDQTYPLLSHANLMHGDFRSAEDYMRSEVGSVSIGSKEYALGLSAPHEILCIEYPYFAVTNTGRNSLVIINVIDWSFKQLRFDRVYWDRFDPSGVTGSHFNSLFFHDGRLHVLAHNFDKGGYSISLSWPDLRRLERTEYSALQLHNLWVCENERHLSCASAAGCLVDVLKNEVLWKCPDEDAYTRGLASYDDYLLVGSSPIRRGLDIDDSDSPTLIWVIDKNKYTTEGYLNLGKCGVVVGIRVADRFDPSHPVGPISNISALAGCPVDEFLDKPCLLGPSE